MKAKVVPAVLVVAAGLFVSTAVAKQPPTSDAGAGTQAGTAGKHEPGRRGLSLVLRGVVAEVGESSLTVEVESASGRGRLLVGEAVEVEVDGHTRVRRQGRATLADLVVGDRVVTLVRVYKARGAEPTFVARQVVAKPVDDAPEGENEAEAPTH